MLDCKAVEVVVGHVVALRENEDVVPPKDTLVLSMGVGVVIPASEVDAAIGAMLIYLALQPRAAVLFLFKHVGPKPRSVDSTCPMREAAEGLGVWPIQIALLANHSEGNQILRSLLQEGLHEQLR